MDVFSSSTVIDIDNTHTKYISSNSTIFTVSSANSKDKEINPILRGNKNALIITVLQVVVANRQYKDLHLMVKVGSSYYKGEVFQLGVRTKNSIAPQSQDSQIKVSSPIAKDKSSGTAPVSKNATSKANLQENANLELFQKFIFWISLHSELFDFIHVQNVQTNLKIPFLIRIPAGGQGNGQNIQTAYIWRPVFNVCDDGHFYDCRHLELLEPKHAESCNLAGNGITLDSTATKGLVGISIEFMSHGISQYYQQEVSLPPSSCDTKLYPISVARKDLSRVSRIYSKPLTVEEAETIYLQARSIKPNACLNCCAPFIDKEVFKAIWDIQSHLENMLRGLELSHALVTFSILLIAKYYARYQIETTGIVETDPSFYFRARLYIKYACVAYGKMVIAFSKRKSHNGSFKDVLLQDKEAIVKYLKIDPAHLLVMQMDQRSIYQPAYLIFYEKEFNSIVLSIRGSLSLFDAVTDLNCDYISWKEGLLHGGFYTCAKWVLKNVVFQKIPQFMSIFNTNKLIVCGHSMGAGVSAILGLLLNDAWVESSKASNVGEYSHTKNALNSFKTRNESELNTPKDIQQYSNSSNEWEPSVTGMFDPKNTMFYCYGSPAVISEHLVEKSQSFNNIFTINYGNDLVSHLSYGSMRDFCSLIMVASKHVSNSFYYYLKENSPAFDQAMEELRRIDIALKGKCVSIADGVPVTSTTGRSSIATLGGLPPDANNNIKLLSAGLYFHMYRSNSFPTNISLSESEKMQFDRLSSEITTPDKHFKVTILERSNAQFYSHMLVTTNAMAHHLPVRYEVGLDRCIQTLSLKDKAI